MLRFAHAWGLAFGSPLVGGPGFLLRRSFGGQHGLRRAAGGTLKAWGSFADSFARALRWGLTAFSPAVGVLRRRPSGRRFHHFPGASLRSRTGLACGSHWLAVRGFRYGVGLRSPRLRRAAGELLEASASHSGWTMRPSMPPATVITWPETWPESSSELRMTTCRATSSGCATFRNAIVLEIRRTCSSST